MSEFWNQFYNLCRAIDLRPTAVGNQLSISSGTINKWKNGAIPNGETLLKLADFFNVSIDYLLGRNNDSQKNIACHSTFQGNGTVAIANETEVSENKDENVEEFQKIIENLTPREKNRLMSMVYEFEENCKKEAK